MAGATDMPGSACAGTSEPTEMAIAVPAIINMRFMSDPFWFNGLALLESRAVAIKTCHKSIGSLCVAARPDRRKRS